MLELKIDYYWTKRSVWNDTEKKKLEDMLGEIIKEFLYCATVMREDRVKKEEEHKRYVEKQQTIYEMEKQKEVEFKKLAEFIK